MDNPRSILNEGLLNHIGVPITSAPQYNRIRGGNCALAFSYNIPDESCDKRQYHWDLRAYCIINSHPRNLCLNFAKENLPCFHRSARDYVYKGFLNSEVAKARRRQVQYDVECTAPNVSPLRIAAEYPVDTNSSVLYITLDHHRFGPPPHPISTITSHLHLLIRPYDNTQCRTRKIPTSSCSSTPLSFLPRSEAPSTATCMYVVSSLLAPQIEIAPWIVFQRERAWMDGWETDTTGLRDRSGRLQLTTTSAATSRS